MPAFSTSTWVDLACKALELSLLNPAEADAALAVVKESFDACVAPDDA